MSERPTPETDQEQSRYFCAVNTVGADFARTLERQRDALRSQLADVTLKHQVACDTIARMKRDDAAVEAEFHARERIVKGLKAKLAEAEKLEDVLYSIQSWCRAYPLAIFPEPDWDEVKEKLGDTLLTRVSASNMRHVVTGIQNIINSAQRGEEKT